MSTRSILIGADNRPIATLTRGAAGWSIAEKGGFAADTGKLREFLLKLADAKLIEQKTANKDKYATLGVEDVADKDAKGVEVALGGLAQPVKLIVGNTNAHGGTFVRRADETQSWLASGNISVDKKAENWLRKDLVDVAANRVESVSITRPDGKTVHISKQDESDANLKLADVPKAARPDRVHAEWARVDARGPALRRRGPGAGRRAHRQAADGAATRRSMGFIVNVVAWEKDGKDYAQLTATTDPDQSEPPYRGLQQEEPARDGRYETRGCCGSCQIHRSLLPSRIPRRIARRSSPYSKRKRPTSTRGSRTGPSCCRRTRSANINKAPDDLLKPLED